MPGSSSLTINAIGSNSQLTMFAKIGNTHYILAPTKYLIKTLMVWWNHLGEIYINHDGENLVCFDEQTPKLKHANNNLIRSSSGVIWSWFSRGSICQPVPTLSLIFLKILAIEMSCNLTRSRRPFWYFGSPKRCIGFLDSWPNSAKICSQYWAEWFPDEPMGYFNLVWNTFNTKRWRLYGIYFRLSYRDMKNGSLCCQVACVCFRLLYEYLKKWQKF